MRPEDYNFEAKYYDDAYKAGRDRKDVDFYLELAKEIGGPVLEVGCGTGRVLLEIAQAGLSIDGLDFAEAQLDVLRKKLLREPNEIRSRVALHTGDMRSFEINRRYKLITYPFRPLQHMYTVEDQVAALTTGRNHLADQGKLAFDVFFPSYRALLETNGVERPDFEWEDPDQPGIKVKRSLVRHTVDFLHQYLEGEFIFRRFRGDELISEERGPIKMGFYSYLQLQALFKHCGLKIAAQYGSYDRDPIEACREMIFVLEKA